MEKPEKSKKSQEARPEKEKIAQCVRNLFELHKMEAAVLRELRKLT
jgi:hypothetical protein